MGLTQPPIKWVMGSFPEVERPRHDDDHPTPSRVEVKERVELNPLNPLYVSGNKFRELATLCLPW